MTVGIYIRVSTEEQANEGYSISAQRERLKAFCKAQNWVDYKFYVDEGISGRDMKRPQFKKLLKDIEAGHINILLVYRLDRMTRSVRDLHKILDILDSYDCVFRSATEVYDTSTAMGKMFITIVAAIAEWESENLGERVIMGQLEKARQGEWAAQPPYGFYKDKNHKLHIHEEQIEAVKLMIKKIREGMSFRQLSEYMASTKYKPKRGYKWHITTLMELMHNPALYGAMYWKGKVYEDTHEGIMTKAEFEELQRVISSRQNYKKRNVTSHFVYQTKLICPDCGNRLTSERYVWKRKDGTQQVRNSYRCQKCALDNKERPPFSVRENYVDEELMKYCENFIVKKSETKKENNDNYDLINNIKTEIKLIERERERYQQGWAKGLIQDKEFESRMRETQTRYNELEKELKELNVPIKSDEDIQKNKELSKHFKENFSFLTQEEKRTFVQTFIEYIQIKVLVRTSKKRYRDQVIEIADVGFY